MDCDLNGHVQSVIFCQRLGAVAAQKQLIVVDFCQLRVQLKRAKEEKVALWL